MVFHPCHTPGGVLEEAYTRRVTGKGPTFQEIQRRRVECPKCGLEVTAVSLLTHRHIQHGMGQGDRGGGVSPPTTQGGPDLLGILLKTLIEAPVPGSEVTGRGIKSDQPPDSLFSLPRVVYNCDPGGR